MNQLEKNVMHSFKLAKRDIILLQEKVIMLSQAQERIMEMLNTLKANNINLYNRTKEVSREIELNKSALRSRPAPKTVIRTVKKVVKRKPVEFVASKTASKFHRKTCPFAKNIKPKHKIVFKSKVKALNEGFKACKCI